MEEVSNYDNKKCCESPCECPVCFENKILNRINCGHYVCPECIQGLLRQPPYARKCPICRKPMTSYGCNGNITNVSSVENPRQYMGDADNNRIHRRIDDDERDYARRRRIEDLSNNPNIWEDIIRRGYRRGGKNKYSKRTRKNKRTMKKRVKRHRRATKRY